MRLQVVPWRPGVGYNRGRSIDSPNAQGEERRNMPVLDREEHVEQAYFFQAFRERLLDGMASQDILARVGEELLSTTRLPVAISFLFADSKLSGVMGPAMARLGHYFTPFQTHVINQAELDMNRFSMDQALLILER